MDDVPLDDPALLGVRRQRRLIGRARGTRRRRGRAGPTARRLEVGEHLATWVFPRVAIRVNATAHGVAARYGARAASRAARSSPRPARARPGR